MIDITAYLTATIGRLTQAVIAFMAVQSRATEITWIGAQAYSAIPQPNLAHPLPAETWFRLTQRLGRLAHRLRTLFARYEANTLPAPRPSRARIPQIRAPQPRLPNARGWIGARIAAAAPCAGAIENLLHNIPQMREFVQAAPQAGRLLRPLAHMLGVTLPEYLRLQPRPPFSPLALGRGEPEGGSRTTNQPRPQGTPDRPLPPEIRAAARAWKKYDR